MKGVILGLFVVRLTCDALDHYVHFQVEIWLSSA